MYVFLTFLYIFLWRILKIFWAHEQNSSKKTSQAYPSHSSPNIEQQNNKKKNLNRLIILRITSRHDGETIKGPLKLPGTILFLMFEEFEGCPQPCTYDSINAHLSMSCTPDRRSFPVCVSKAFPRNSNKSKRCKVVRNQPQHMTQKCTSCNCFFSIKDENFFVHKRWYVLRLFFFDKRRKSILNLVLLNKILDCNHTFPMDLAPNWILFAAKSIGNV